MSSGGAPGTLRAHMASPMQRLVARGRRWALRCIAGQPSGARLRSAAALGGFLAHMGAPQRLMQLLESDETTDAQAEALVEAYERLADPEQMGERYKVLAFVDARQTAPPPGGFGPPQHVK